MLDRSVLRSQVLSFSNNEFGMGSAGVDFLPRPVVPALDALDGLDGDADVAFVVTTNRVEVLEHVLADRPGRVDLAVEIPVPDDASRRRLFEVYASALPLSHRAVTDTAARSAGVNGTRARSTPRRASWRASLTPIMPRSSTWELGLSRQPALKLG